MRRNSTGACKLVDRFGFSCPKQIWLECRKCERGTIELARVRRVRDRRTVSHKTRCVELDAVVAEEEDGECEGWLQLLRSEVVQYE